MLILGAISGIQEFVFALPAEGGGQARMLRARSFFVQALTEVAAFRTQQALGLGRDSLVFCAAGRFGLDAAQITGDVHQPLRALRRELEMWLLQRSAGRLRITIVVEPPLPPGPSDGAERYERTLAALLAEKYRPWASSATDGNSWESDRLVIPSPAPEDAELFYEIGQALPRARWLVIEAAAQDARSTAGPTFDVAGFRATLLESAPPETLSRASLVADLAAEDATPSALPDNRIRRPLARHVPTREDGSPVWFEELVQDVRGGPLLGVLKMDVDSLGAALGERLRGRKTLGALGSFSADLDRFFAMELERLLRTPQWQRIYTVFSGGDDVLVVGPWDLILDFAARAQQAFAQRFAEHGLTISGGLAIVKYRYPIRHAVALAEDLLHLAKTEANQPADHPKDQLAALGQIWKWRDHHTVVERAKQLVQWVESGVARRGWLHTMLRLTSLSLGRGTDVRVDEQLLAPARLGYHVARNYPTSQDKHPERGALRSWADRMVAGLAANHQITDAEVRYLPAILRYALLATRPRTSEETR